VDLFFPSFLHLCIADSLSTDMMRRGLFMMLDVVAFPVFWNSLLGWEVEQSRLCR
jgi:hypothetical protein